MEITLPDSITSIEEAAFASCTGLESVEITDGVNSIGNYAFSHCSSLQFVKGLVSVTSIGIRAFQFCTALEKVNIPNSTISIGIWAFKGCNNLKEIEVHKNNPEYTSEDGVLFDKSKTVLIQCPPKKNGNYTIPSSVKTIVPSAFESCSSLTRITFEGDAPSLILLGSNVFKDLPIGSTITVLSGATGFGETFGGLPVIVEGELVIKSFKNHATPFSLTFETESDSTYKIEASHDLKKWGEIGEVQGTGSSVKFIERRKAMFLQQYYRVKLVE